MSAYPPAVVVGGNWSASDAYVDAFNGAGQAHGVPPNLLRAIVQRESGGVWYPESNPTDKYRRKRRNGLPNLLMGFSGIYETTSEGWGCDWQAMKTSPAAQVWCMARGLRRLYDAYGAGDWGRAATVYFGGTAALERVFCDEQDPPMCSDEYARKALADWRALDAKSGGTMAVYTIPGLGNVTLSFPLRVALMPPTQTDQRPGRPFNGGSWDWYTQHETANTNAGANVRMHERWLREGAGGQQLGFHLCVDDAEAAVFVPLDEIAWHAGDSGGPGNMDSVACELCVNRDADKARARANAAELAGQVLRARGLPIERLVQHNKWSGKNCPMQLRAEAGAWDRFVADAARQLTAAPPPPTQTFPWPGGLTDADAAALSGIEPAPNFADPRQTWARAWAEETVRTGLYSPHAGTHAGAGYRLFQLQNGRVWRIEQGQARGAWMSAGGKG